VGRVTAWTLALLATLPDVRATHVVVDAAGGEEWRVTVDLRNCGFLGTHCSVQALAVGAVRAHGMVSLELGVGQALAHGQLVHRVPHLTGREKDFDSTRPVGTSGTVGNTNELRLEWNITGGRGGRARVTADFGRGGSVECVIDLDDSDVGRSGSSNSRL
jgi:hypothetical protein